MYLAIGNWHARWLPSDMSQSRGVTKFSTVRWHRCTGDKYGG